MYKKILSLLLTFFSVAIFAQEAYYNDVDLNLSGLSLKNALATKIIATHTKMLNYSPDVWNASKITDANPSNSSEVILIYGWENGTDSDATNDLYRDNSLQDTGSGSSFVWNREHVFSRSLANPSLSTNDPGAGTDAHNLRPADRSRNSARGNQKFATGSGNSGNVTGGWYPGDDWKGDVARMMMYMYLRYGDQCKPTFVGIGDSSSTSDDMIDLFLKWNAEDPVSDVEKKRNQYHGNTSNTYAQGNRNPFIDNPYLATRIWGGTAAEDIWGIYTTTDTEAPTVPTNVMLSSITASSMNATWTASTDNVGVTSYDVYVNGSLKTSSTTTSASITGLTPNTDYSITVLAKDLADNKSAQSTAANGKTLEDTTAPSIPTNIVISNQTDTGFKVTWTASTDDVAVSEYEVYLDGNLNSSSSNTEKTITGLSSSTTFAVTVLAKDTAGNKSAQTSAVNATTLDAVSSANELFFSEYVEGGGNNKALEIANITSSSVDLSAYSVKRQSNGAGEWVSELVLSGSLASGDVFVIINGQADNQTLIDEADLVVENVSPNWGAPVNFNGNDPVGLFKNGVLIDIIGVFNGGSGKFAEDKTLRRKSTVSQPTTTFDEAGEWDVFAKDNVDDIGKYTSTLSIETLSTSEYQLYPNPFTAFLQIKTANGVVIDTIKIYTIQGKEVFKTSNPNSSINLQSLQKGIYLIKIISGKKSATEKLIKH